MWPEWVLERLKARPKKHNVWKACCPAHHDRTPSLSIWIGKRGRLLIYCHAGCDKKAILESAGLRMGNLFPEDESNAYTREGFHPVRRVERYIVATYDYTDEAGKILYQKVRYEPKEFSQRRPDGHGDWIWNLDGVRRVLFHLPAIIEAHPKMPVLIVEGEKDVLTAESLGLLATTTTDGAGSGWEDDTYPCLLRGRRVAIIPDNDVKGTNHAKRIAGALMLGGVGSVRIAVLPREHDLSDWVAAGGTKQDLIALMQSTPEWLPK